MQKKSLMTLAVIGAVGAGLAGALTASAHMGGWARTLTPAEQASEQSARFEHQAALLGVSVDQVKEAWAAGKGIMELAEELGISEEDVQNRMQVQREEQMNEHLQSLVEQGVITQAQADQRKEVMKDRAGQSGKNMRHSGRGMHKEFNW